MTITTHRIDTSYDDTVYNFIKREEALVRRVYSDGDGVPTLGVGYALLIKDSATGLWIRKPTLYSDLQAIGIQLTSQGTLPQADEELLNVLLGNLNAGHGGLNIGTGPNQVLTALLESDVDGNLIENSLNSTGLNEFSFSILDDTKVRQLFEISITDIRTQIRNRFAANLAKIAQTDSTITNPTLAASSMFAGLDGSKEMVALSSLAFTNPSIVGPKLTAALWYGDRAEAWYEIRYDSNADGKHANRRYHESAEFGLYNDASNPDDADAKAAYRMFTRHANTPITTKVTVNGVTTTHTYQGIVDYQNNFSPASANSYTIQTELDPAYQYLLNNYVRPVTGVDIAWDNIYIGEDQSSAYYNHTDSDTNLTGSAYNDLILGESGDDTIDGGAGWDVIYGGSGNDTLTGGTGDDYVDGDIGATASVMVNGAAQFGVEPVCAIEWVPTERHRK